MVVATPIPYTVFLVLFYHQFPVGLYRDLVLYTKNWNFISWIAYWLFIRIMSYFTNFLFWILFNHCFCPLLNTYKEKHFPTNSKESLSPIAFQISSICFFKRFALTVKSHKYSNIFYLRHFQRSFWSCLRFLFKQSIPSGLSAVPN